MSVWLHLIMFYEQAVLILSLIQRPFLQLKINLLMFMFVYSENISGYVANTLFSVYANSFEVKQS